MQFKPFEKMTALEVVVFCLMAVCSGVMVGIGGVSSLLASVWLGDWGRLVGAVLFSLGIFTIVTYEMKLFTGMVAEIPKMGAKNYWKLPVCFLCNALGVGVVALLAHYSPVGELIIGRSQSLISTKLSANDWALRALCSSILCGILITVSVRCRSYTQKKGVSSTLGVTFPIVVFAFCGFDHSVANMLHFFYLGQCTWQIVGYILVSILGNLIGGVAFPMITLLRKYVDCERAKRANETPNCIDD